MPREKAFPVVGNSTRCMHCGRAAQEISRWRFKRLLECVSCRRQWSEPLTLADAP